MTDMKTRAILFAAVAAMLSVSCGQVSDVTEITGKVLLPDVTQVKVEIEAVIDTIVPVTDGQFFVTVPTDIAKGGIIAIRGVGRVNFIPDGTPLTVTFDEKPAIASKYPRISVQERLNTYLADEDVLMEEYRAKQEEIAADTTLTKDEQGIMFEVFFKNFAERYYGHHKEACKANPENYIAVVALSNLRGQLSDDETAALFEGLNPALLEDTFIKDMKSALDARLETSAGKMFKDFTVNSVVGHTRSIPAQPIYSEVKLSDYVGKGKYILLDFWAPWCGPCKREMPYIKSAYYKHRKDNFDVVSVAVWERQPVEVTIQTAEELGMVWNQINNAGREAATIYGVEGIPHLVLFGPDGTILDRGFHGTGIEATLAKYLK